MKSPLSRRTWRVVAGLAAAIVLGAVSMANGTPPGGVSTKVTLADVTTLNTVRANVPGLIKFRTRGQVEIAQFSNTAQPGFSSGWHEHTGPILVAVTAGELTFYDRAGIEEGGGCRVTHVSAGHGYLETPLTPILARNEGSIEADWTTTQIIPVGGSQRVDSTTGFCGVS